jgi:hypothetical protein
MKWQEMSEPQRILMNIAWMLVVCQLQLNNLNFLGMDEHYGFYHFCQLQ